MLKLLVFTLDLFQALSASVSSGAATSVPHVHVGMKKGQPPASSQLRVPVVHAVAEDRLKLRYGAARLDRT